MKKSNKRKKNNAYGLRQTVGPVIERKVVDKTTSLITPAGASTFTGPNVLNTMVQGTDGEGEHIGRKVRMKSILIRWKAYLDPGTTQGGSIRVLIVYDKQTRGVNPIITEILTANDFLAPNLVSLDHQYITIFDELIHLSSGANWEQSGVWFKKFELDEVFFDTFLGTVADIASGGIFAFAAQSNTLSIADNIVFDYRSRIRFTDA